MGSAKFNCSTNNKSLYLLFFQVAVRRARLKFVFGSKRNGFVHIFPVSNEMSGAL